MQTQHKEGKREIKFRAWDKEQKEMRTIQDNWSISILNDKKHYEVMQFTGLTDKNGKDIYEGDILSIKNGFNNIYEVIYKKGCFYIGQDYLYKYVEPVFECEVIGNVFENPELLKKRNYKK